MLFGKISIQDIINNRKKAQEVLRRLFPNNVKKVNIMLLALDEQIPQYIYSKNFILSDYSSIDFCILKLIDSYGMTSYSASEAVGSWVELIKDQKWEIEPQRIKRYYAIHRRVIRKLSLKSCGYLQFVDDIYGGTDFFKSLFEHDETFIIAKVDSLLKQQTDRNTIDFLRYYYGLQDYPARPIGLLLRQFSENYYVNNVFDKGNNYLQPNPSDIECISFMLQDILERIRSIFSQEPAHRYVSKHYGENIRYIDYIKEDIRELLHGRKRKHFPFGYDLKINGDALKLDLDIRRTNISQKCFRFLMLNSINNIQQLMQLSPEDIKSFRHIDETVYKETMQLVQKHKEPIDFTNTQLRGNEKRQQEYINSANEKDRIEILYTDLNEKGLFLFNDQELDIPGELCHILLNAGYLYSEDVKKDFIYLKEKFSGTSVEKQFKTLETTINRSLYAFFCLRGSTEWIDNHLNKTLSLQDGELFFRQLGHIGGFHILFAKSLFKASIIDPYKSIQSFIKLICDFNRVEIIEDMCTTEFKNRTDISSCSVCLNFIINRELHQIHVPGMSCDDSEFKYVYKRDIVQTLNQNFV